MDKNKILDIVFIEWKASLKSKDRSSKSVGPNFEELFSKWKALDIDFHTLYEEWLPKAIKAHYPSQNVVRNTYAKLKREYSFFSTTEREFVAEWQQTIDDTATQLFFEFFPIPKLDIDDEPKVYGNMSAKEYRAQRRYAEQFPTLDTTELEKRWQDQQYNLDIEDLIQNVLGNEDDKTNA